MFFKKKNVTEEKIFAPGTEIPYRPGLIAKLKRDHDELLRLYVKIGESLEKQNARSLSECLREFARLLRTHLLEENVCLYLYLKHVLKAEPDSLEIVTFFQREMGEIGKAVNQFLTRNINDAEWTPQRFTQFAEEYRAIGSALARRIEQEEESLYSLYLPPSAFHS